MDTAGMVVQKLTRLFFLSVVAVMGSACVVDESEEPVAVDAERRLADVAPVSLAGSLVQSPATAASAPLVVRLVYPGIPTGPHEGQPCSLFPSFFATINRLRAHVSTSGGWARDALFCQNPSASAPFSIGPEQTTEMTIGDSSMRLTMQLGDLLQPRTATFIDEPAQGYRRGETVKVRWSHPGDLAAGHIRVAVSNGNVPQVISNLTIEGDLVSFPMPTQGLVAGAITIRLYESRELSLCEGACELAIKRDLTFSRTLRD